MKAMAKNDFGYREYNYKNWVKGNSYDCMIKEDGKKIDICDEKGIVFHFSGRAKKNLSSVFEFIDENLKECKG